MKLLLDLKKYPGKLDKLPFGKLPVYLLAHDKKAAKQAQHYSRNSKDTEWQRLPEKKQVAAIVKHLRQLLKTKPHARLAVVSHRKKLHKACRELCAEFPDADITVWKRCGKKCRKFLKKALEKPAATANPKKSLKTKEKTALNKPASPTTLPVQPLSDHELFQETVERIEQAVAHVLQQEQAAALPETETQATQTPESKSSPTDPRIRSALMLLKKNQPRKKVDLLETLSLSLHFSDEESRELVEQLEREKHIQIDVAENVKYNH